MLNLKSDRGHTSSKQLDEKKYNKDPTKNEDSVKIELKAEERKK